MHSEATQMVALYIRDKQLNEPPFRSRWAAQRFPVGVSHLVVFGVQVRLGRRPGDVARAFCLNSLGARLCASHFSSKRFEYLAIGKEMFSRSIKGRVGRVVGVAKKARGSHAMTLVKRKPRALSVLAGSVRKIFDCLALLHERCKGDRVAFEKLALDHRQVVALKFLQCFSPRH